ncbi:DUF3721 domain-containing protein [Cyanobium sp. T1B-Tous]|uniref:DUF3721 domain-containing protein n=1 Tax=Cyanobium sp. T1B-Tous TaxID=2823721 RepID=UPI0020CE98A0|nr:DUF3721 domain-containing protein [Cyanobium sp. T1B-Tous]MCP9806548.1 DUF3721 domain-containing protein [Cyanobium sp. T1B-Tous]
MDAFALSSRLILLALAVAAAPLAGHAHPKGLYDNQQQAEQRAKELGCTGTHQNSGKWMPCSDEATLHHHLRHH